MFSTIVTQQGVRGTMMRRKSGKIGNSSSVIIIISLGFRATRGVGDAHEKNHGTAATLIMCFVFL